MFQHISRLLAAINGIHVIAIYPMIKNISLAFLLDLLPLSLAARGDASSGKEKAKVCETCHGNDGKSVEPSYPNLAGQHDSYLQKALADYR